MSGEPSGRVIDSEGFGCLCAILLIAVFVAGNTYSFCVRADKDAELAQLRMAVEIYSARRNCE